MLPLHLAHGIRWYQKSVLVEREGEWEGSKVRDLLDALDDLNLGVGKDRSIALSNVFVTKHEVLMLRRKMESG